MKFSVVIPCYNQGRFLTDAVRSLLAQTHRDVEIIVIDDGSTDNTAAVAKQFGDAIRYQYQSNDGLASARNAGIRAATGDYLLFLDSDDYLRPTMLERVAAVIPEGEAVVVHGTWEEVDIDGRTLCPAEPVRPLPVDTLHALLTENFAPPNCVVVPMAGIRKAGMFSLDRTLRGCEDWDLWIRLAAAGFRFIAAPDAVSVYRRYEGSMSRSNLKMWRAGKAVLEKNSAHHPHCRQCRQAIAAARGKLRRSSFNTLRPQLSATRHEAGNWACAKLLVTTFYHDPFMLPFIISRKVKYLRHGREAV